MTDSQTTCRYHLARTFPGRNDDHVATFANGHTQGRSDRRVAVRQLVAMTRRADAHAVADRAAAAQAQA